MHETHAKPRDVLPPDSKDRPEGEPDPSADRAEVTCARCGHSEHSGTCLAIESTGLDGLDCKCPGPEVAKAEGPKPLLTTYEKAAIRKRMAELRWQVAQAYDEIHRLAEEIKQDRINEKALKEAT